MAPEDVVWASVDWAIHLHIR